LLLQQQIKGSERVLEEQIAGCMKAEMDNLFDFCRTIVCQRAGWIKAEIMGQLNLRVRKLHAQSSESDGLPSLFKLQGVEDIWFDG
jgi:hypothetical protein